MTKRVHFLFAMVIGGFVLSACHGLGTTTETYVNQKDTKQTLELTKTESAKGLFHSIPNMGGSFTLFTDQKITSGKYTRDETAYILRSTDEQEFKITIQQDSSLRDQNGDVWKLSSVSRSFRPHEMPPTLKSTLK